MNLFKVTYHLRSAVASEWQSDTIFGHLCWALRYLDGEDTLDQFLADYERTQPPLIISNGFPAGLLPRPATPPLSPRQRNEESIKQQIEGFKRSKEAKETTLLTPEEFTRAIRGEEVVPISKRGQLPSPGSTMKNQINRLTGTTGDGSNLYEFDETFWSRIDEKMIVDIPISIYVKVREDFTDQAERLFSFIAAQGYGKRKSVGYGEIRSHSFEEFHGFETPPDANGFVSLSNFVPAHSDPRIGTWQTIIKYGKLGEEYAIGGNPHKRPLLMFTAGSTFRDTPCREYYGRLVKNIAPSSPYRKVVQYALAFPVPIKIDWGVDEQ